MPGLELALTLVVQFIVAIVFRRVTLSIRDTIKSAVDIESEVIEIPQWDQVKIEVRSMSGRARAKLLRQAVQPDGSMDFEALYPSVLIACCHDPDTGELVFSEEDMAWINDKSAGPVEKLAQIGMRLSGLTQEAVNEGKESSS